MKKRNSKYNARKVKFDGHLFPSIHEAERYKVLKAMEADGVITNLRLQVPLALLPSQRGADGKVIERGVKYIADFVYEKDRETVWEDAKGKRTADYIIKRKLALWVHGIRIKEV